MSKTYKDSPDERRQRRQASRTRQRNISVRAVRRDPPDLRKLSRALIALAMAEAEAEAVDQTATDADTSPRTAEEAPDVR